MRKVQTAEAKQNNSNWQKRLFSAPGNVLIKTILVKSLAKALQCTCT